MTDWMVQIFAVSDATAQELIVGLLGGVDDIVVTSSSNRSGHFVVTECADESQARAIFRIVTSIDVEASVVHTVGDPTEPLSA